MISPAHGVKIHHISLIAFVAVGALFGTAVLAAAHSCKCRANGHDYEQGQIMCIRGQLARCEMNQNNSSWKVIANNCPEVEYQSVPSNQTAQLLSTRPLSGQPE